MSNQSYPRRPSTDGIGVSFIDHNGVLQKSDHNLKKYEQAPKSQRSSISRRPSLQTSGASEIHANTSTYRDDSGRLHTDVTEVIGSGQTAPRTAARLSTEKQSHNVVTQPELHTLEPNFQPNPFKDVISDKWHTRSTSPKRDTQQTGIIDQPTYVTDSVVDDVHDMQSPQRYSTDATPQTSVIHPDNSRVSNAQRPKSEYVDSKGFVRTGISARWYRFKDKLFKKNTDNSNKETGASVS